jgi:NAD(P)-dependent dehydrogenase (short-subunit alcohol dehydrogenase family)
VVERRVLVTGGNSGIGLATVLNLAGSGFRVFGSARDADKASAIEDAAARAGVSVETVVLDVTDEVAAEKIVPGL